MGSNVQRAAAECLWSPKPIPADATGRSGAGEQQQRYLQALKQPLGSPRPPTCPCSKHQRPAGAPRHAGHGRSAGCQQQQRLLAQEVVQVQRAIPSAGQEQLALQGAADDTSGVERVGRVWCIGGRGVGGYAHSESMQARARAHSVQGLAMAHAAYDNAAVVHSCCIQLAATPSALLTWCGDTATASACPAWPWYPWPLTALRSCSWPPGPAAAVTAAAKSAAAASFRLPTWQHKAAGHGAERAACVWVRQDWASCIPPLHAAEQASGEQRRT